MAANAATEAFRLAQGDLVTLALADLDAFWRTLDTSDLAATQRAILSFLPGLVQEYGEIGASLAADFYEELRDGSPDVRRLYSAIVSADVVPIEQAQVSARWALGSLWKPTGTPEESAAATLENLSGITNRLALVPARDTVRLNTVSDTESIGWRRVSQGATCKFCLMLVGRGNVYSPDTARFAAHDHCDCIAEPAWGGGEPATVDQYMASKRNPTKADRARVKEFLRGMPD